jgi:CxxC motif-containing protein
MKKEMVCINCPRGCTLEVEWEEGSKDVKVTGNFCPRGAAYGKSEILAPARTVTSTAKVEGGVIPRVSVKTDKPIPKGRIFDVMAEINKLDVTAPVKIGDVLIPNVLGLESNVVATKTVEKKA